MHNMKELRNKPNPLYNLPLHTAKATRSILEDTTYLTQETDVSKMSKIIKNFEHRLARQRHTR